MNDHHSLFDQTSQLIPSIAEIFGWPMLLSLLAAGLALLTFTLLKDKMNYYAKETGTVVSGVICVIFIILLSHSLHTDYLEGKSVVFNGAAWLLVALTLILSLASTFAGLFVFNKLSNEFY